MSIHLRPASPDDAEALVSVTEAAIRGLSGEQYSPEERAAWIDGVSESSMREGLETPTTTTFVAEENRQIVGFSSLDGWQIRALYVHPDAQGTGVGTDLLQAVEAEAKHHGRSTVEVSASLNSVGFYESHGYERTSEGVIELDDHVEIRCIDMHKPLS